MIPAAFVYVAVSLVALLGSPQAQTTIKGVISGRVVNSDGTGLANIAVNLTPAAMERYSQRRSGSTDEDGNFRFTEVLPGAYTVNAMDGYGYVTSPLSSQDRLQRRVYRLGETATLTMIKGGVITGRVTNAEGEPLIAMPLTAIMVRSEDGGPISSPIVSPASQAFTDDRGIYRFYGLAPGVYLVVANTGNPYFSSQASLYDFEVPTYYPSSTRDTAVEVRVTSGGEVTGVDIRYRGGRGHAISGSLVGFQDSVSVALNDVGTHAQIASTYVFSGSREAKFDFYGVPDGEYEISARTDEVGAGTVQPAASDPKRISIRGTDVTGLELRLLPLATIAGRVVVETSQTPCEKSARISAQEVFLVARPEEKPITAAEPIARASSAEARIDDKGLFEIRGLSAHRYRFWVNLPNESLFVKSISLDSAPNTAPARPVSGAGTDISRNGILAKRGEKLSGVSVIVAEGAASLRGRAMIEKSGSRLPSRLRIHMVPSETTSADAVLRYAETFSDSDGKFALTGIAPGKYWLLVIGVPEDEPFDRPASPRAWDAADRIKLRREAEAAKVEIELKACQRVVDQIVRYVGPTQGSRP